MMTERLQHILAILLLAAAAEAHAQSQQDDVVVAEPGADGTVVVPGGVIGRYGEDPGVDPEDFDFSDAEERLWLGDHLKNIDRPARLYYEFQKTGSFEDGFTDSVFLDILKINPDGTRNADMQFFTGGRAQPFSPDNVTEITGNPVLGVYMRGDVHDMSRLTSGNWRYFQRSIKMAFAENASVEPVTIDFAGRSVNGYKVSITPFVKDPRRRLFEQFAEKRYEFILSDDIPGTIYQIHTVVPDPDGKGQPLIEETLTLREVRYRAGS